MLTSSEALTLLAAAIIGYGCGSVPFGLLLTRIAGVGDVRTIGSGNIGATNVLRTGRKDLAAATLVLDAAKGAVAVVLARMFLGEDAALAAALGAFVGHIFPVWLRFRGGKGVATFLGVLVALAWPAALAFALVWLAVAAATRYSSAAALAGSLAAPALLFARGHQQAAIVVAVMTAIVWWTHRGNIERLLAGREGRIGQKA